MERISPKETLDVRLKHYVNKFNSKFGDRYEYIGGFKSQGNKIIIKCKKCGRQREIIAHNIYQRPKSHGDYSDKLLCICEGRADKLQIDTNYYREIVEKNIGFKLVKVEFNKNIHKNIIHVKCTKCGLIYKYNHRKFLVTPTLNCCVRNSKYDRQFSNYKSYVKTVAKTIFPLKEDYGIDNLLNYKEVIEKEIKERTYQAKSQIKKMDLDVLKKMLEEEAKSRIEKYKVGRCSICEETKKGNPGWGRTDRNWKHKICAECSIEQVFCECCKKAIQRRYFRFIEEEGRYSYMCKACEKRNK